MKQTHAFKAVAATVVTAATIAAPAALAAGTAPKVTIRVEGLSKTLLSNRTLQTSPATVERSGHPIVGTTALGALNTAVKGKWSGSWSSEYKEWEITGIKGENHSFSSKYFWALYVNHVQASSGAGEVKLKSGENVVYAALPDSDYDEQLLGIEVTHTSTAGRTLTGTVVAYNAKGKAVPLSGAHLAITGAKVSRTQAAKFSLRPEHAGTLTVDVSKKGFVRDEVTIKIKKA